MPRKYKSKLFYNKLKLPVRMFKKIKPLPSINKNNWLNKVSKSNSNKNKPKKYLKMHNHNLYKLKKH
jgi:hypothetical protein